MLQNKFFNILLSVIIVALAGAGLYFVLTSNFIPTPPPSTITPKAGSITVKGEIVCLPKKGPGPFTEECAIGLLGEDGQHYGLKNFSAEDAEVGSQVEVSGVFTPKAMPGPGGSTYDAAGMIDISSIDEVSQNGNPPAPKGCTQEAKLCPDGSAVGRTGPNCEFAPCPDSSLPKPAPSELNCTLDSDCPSANYICEATLGYGTVYPDGSQPPTNTIIEGECKLKAGNACSSESLCASGLLCYSGICISPVGKSCSGPEDSSCPTDFECVQGCGPPVARQDDPPPPYFCQLKGYVRACPICLSGNTLIDTPLGQVSVKALKKGMPIWTADTQGRHVLGVIMEISEVAVPPSHQMVDLALKDGRELLVSPGHPTTDGRTVGELLAGDSYDGALVVSAQLVVYNQEKTYDVLPSGETGFYWANGILLGSTLK